MIPIQGKSILESLNQPEYEIQAAADAEEAYAKIKKWQPHLVVTDHDMPEVSGLELLKNLRQNQIYVTVIFVSGRTDSKTVAEVLRSGADDFIRKPFRLEELQARVEVALRHNEAHRELFEVNSKLQELVDRDHLTGLYNMRSVYEKIDYELKRCSRTGEQIACVMLDMDHFKTVNDENDHLFGSFVLKEMGKLITENIRDVDFAARYGGDEFLVVLNSTHEEGVVTFCERIRELVEHYEFRDGDNYIQLTISLGYSLSGDAQKINARDLVRSADHALYEAKNAGRNRFAKAN
ncbi:MAG: diguanylate cyclase [Bdellovibrionales bacterium]